MENIHGKMKALVFHGPHKLSVEERPIPSIAEEDVLLRTRMTAVCGSDVQPYVEGTGGVDGQVFGHEFVAEAADLGSKVQGLSLGQRVFGNNAGVCGECWYCKNGMPMFCRSSLKYYTGKHLKHPGALAQYIAFEAPKASIPQAPHINSLMPIPDCVSDEAAALIEPFGVGIATVEKSRVREDGTLVILGAGTIGLCALQWAKHLGIRTIITDICDNRLNIAKLLGADHVINSSQGDCYKSIAGLIGEIGWVKGDEATPADAVIDCAGYPGSLNDALHIVRAGGTVVEISDSSRLSPVNITYISYKNVSICNCCECDTANALDGLSKGFLKAQPLISGTVGLEEAETAFRLQAEGKAVKMLVRMKD